MEKKIELGNLNTENLKKTIELLKTIDREKFTMSMYRSALEMARPHKIEVECKSIGCIIGHSTILDKKMFEICKLDQEEPFSLFSMLFFGDLNQYRWNWLFAAKWSKIDPSLERTIARLEWTLENGFPQDSYIQAMMNGEQQLIY